ncbi:hypothetical protein [Selenomonas sputigena]|uniref:hypothetical protein n=1 Tax=Selenomonas sputigena TaxID=69823 RepID=UPI00222EA14C|nr:hypothetical protein [Selenomonas sputigena]UZD42317.1 hypothetical protein OL240_07135 [Selenomonas sputigena]
MTISPLHEFLFLGIIPQRRPFMKKNEKTAVPAQKGSRSLTNGCLAADLNVYSF